MQRPTCTNVRIRSTTDAHKIFYAVQRNLLPMVGRRLDADERLALRSGCVYAWEERGPHTEITGLGIERFTEGRRWSPSRVRDEFLFYYEKYSPPQDAGLAGPSDKQPPRDWDPLVKQTYSVWVETEKGRRKWHLTAYFTQATVDQLGTIDDNPDISELVVPENHFQSTRVGKNRKATDESQGRSGDVFRGTSTVTRTYAPFPVAYPPAPPAPARAEVTPPAVQQSPRLFEPYSQNLTYSQAPAYYPSESNISQYPVSPSAAPAANHFALPPIRSTQPPSYDNDRRVGQSPIVPTVQQQQHQHQQNQQQHQQQHSQQQQQQQYIDYNNRNDFYNRRPSLEYAQSESTENAYRSPSIMSDSKFISSGPYSPVHELQQSPLGPTYGPYSHTTTKYDEPNSSGEHSPPYHPSPPPAGAFADRQPSLFMQHDIPSGYSLRASHPPDHIGSNGSSPPPYGYDYSYNSDQQTHTDTRASSEGEEGPLTPGSVSSHSHISHSVSSRSVSASFQQQYPYDLNGGQLGCSFESENGKGGVGPHRVDLAPLHSLQRGHPYRRDPVDDKTLRRLGPRKA